MAISVQEVRARGRVTRRPSHTFQLRTRPWQIQPFLLAPVLPGETLNNALLQARVVTDPIKNSLIGWWNEYYLFYVKHRDLAEREELTEMMLDPAWTSANIDHPTGDTDFYHGGGTGNINWSILCLRRVVEEYFRNEGEAWDAFKIGDLPLASAFGQTAFDSLTDTTVMPEGTDIDTADVVIPEALEGAWRMWQYQRMNQLTSMDYEDFLQTYGVKPKKEELHKPELIRMVRDWSYPTNTIDPTDGSASAAVSWAMAERADKDRFFREPGFIFGVTVARPKVYMGKQSGSVANIMNTAFNWLPAVMKEDVYSSLKEVAADSGVLPDTTNGYWLDIRDLLLYGDQFINFALTETNAGLVALPTAGLQARYATATDADGLFASASPLNQIRQDGIVSLNILGTQVDHTPGTASGMVTA